MSRKKILGINGSASINSTNRNILNNINKYLSIECDYQIIDNLNTYPHFQTELTDSNVPEDIVNLHNEILNSDGIIISSPEYIFSIPSRLKNIIEWCVSTTVFSDKPICIITASASGEKGHEELKLIMKTVQAKISEELCLLIRGAKGKFDQNGDLIDESLEEKLKSLIKQFEQSI